MVSIIIKFCHAVRVVSFFVNLSVQSREDEILKTAKTLGKTVEVRPKLRAVSSKCPDFRLVDQHYANCNDTPQLRQVKLRNIYAKMKL